MEIVTVVTSGSLTHKGFKSFNSLSLTPPDSMGTKETIHKGSIQYMSAGTGIAHSEFNENPSDPLSFLQIWILPTKSGLEPAYGSWSPTSPEELTS